MSDLLRLVMDLLHQLAPLRTVAHWEQGIYLFCGRYQFTARPGLKLVVPFFTDVHCVSVVPRNEKTPLNTVTLRDGRTLTYQAALFFQVVDAAKAYLSVDNWQETIVELADGMLSELIAESDPKRFEPERNKRANLRAELCEEINEQCGKYGVKMLDISFTQFVVNVRAYRLMGGERGLKSEK